MPSGHSGGPVAGAGLRGGAKRLTQDLLWALALVLAGALVGLLVNAVSSKGIDLRLALQGAGGG